MCNAVLACSLQHSCIAVTCRIVYTTFSNAADGIRRNSRCVAACKHYGYSPMIE